MDQQLHNLSVDLARLRGYTFGLNEKMDLILDAVHTLTGVGLCIADPGPLKAFVLRGSETKLRQEPKPKGGDSMPDDPLGQVGFHAEQLKAEIKDIVQRLDLSSDAILMLGILKADLKRFSESLDSLGS